MNRILHLASLSLGVICACGHAHAQHDDESRTYGYPGQSGSGPAAPSTIPGRGDSNARVPDVRPAPSVQPKPRKPGAPASPWGGTAGTQTPNTAPMPNKPATPHTSSQPPVAQNGSGPTTSTTPGASTPPPSQPQAGANDRLATAYRGLAGTGAVVRGGAAPIKGGSTATGGVVATSSALACTKNGNTPKISGVRPANEASLQPGQAFIVQGLCFGDGAGSVRVTLPTQYGRIQGADAKILDWQGDKILAQLPDGIVKAIPGAASVEVVAAGGTRGASRDIPFEPRWDKVPLRDLRGMASVGVCGSPVHDKAINRCEITDQGELSGTHQTGSGIDRYEFTLAHGMRLAGCSIATDVSIHDAVPDGEATVRVEAAAAIVDWRFKPIQDYKRLSYRLACQAWAPAGLVAP